MTTQLAFYVTPKAAIYLVNLALASVLISFCGLLASALLGRQSAIFRHAILVSALALALLAPGLTWCACQSGWGRIAISLADPAAQRLPPSADATPAKDPAVKTRADNLPSDAAPLAFPFTLHSSQKASHEETRAVASVPAVPQASGRLPNDSPASSATAASWRLVAISLAAWTWFLGALIAAGWVVRGFLVLRRFCRSLEIPSLVQLEQAADEAAKALRIERLPPIRVSARAPAPLSLGLLHPLIALPKDLAEESDAEQLRAILVHEAAHLLHHHHWIGLRSGWPAFCSGGIRSCIGSIAAFCNFAKKSATTTCSNRTPTARSSPAFWSILPRACPVFRAFRRRWRFSRPAIATSNTASKTC